MRQSQRPVFAAIGAALLFGLGLATSTGAQEGHDHGAPLLGGKVAMTKSYHFEVVFAEDGLKVYPRTHEDKPIDPSKLTGTATFHHPNSPKPWFDRPLTVTAASPGQSPASLGASVNTATLPAKGAKVALKVSGLPDPAESTATFDVPFAPSTSGAIVVAKATKADEKAVAAQKTCPVSNEGLDSMGMPGLLLVSLACVRAEAQGSGSSRINQPSPSRPAPNPTQPAPTYAQPQPVQTRAATPEEFHVSPWRHLVREKAPYTQWAPPPGREGLRKAEGPHGPFDRTYANAAAVADMKSLPPGSILILEDYTEGQKGRTGIEVLYWVKGYDPKAVHTRVASGRRGQAPGPRAP